LSLVTAPTGQAVTTDDAKLFLRVDHDDENDVIDDAVKAATEFCQEETGRQYLTASYTLRLRGWWMGPFTLPKPPMRSVTSITYIDTAGATQTLAGTYYESFAPLKGPGQIVRFPFQVWPVHQADREYPVIVTFSAGYGTAADIPFRTRQAILMATAWFYDHRDPGQLELQAVRSLLAHETWGL
jgi:uncharacterized phiE125 gp8 family phage protein